MLFFCESNEKTVDFYISKKKVLHIYFVTELSNCRYVVIKNQ